MSNKFKQTIILILTGFHIGCATVATGPAFTGLDQVEPKEGLATVYIYREYAEPTAWGSTIYVDSQRVATLNQGGYTWIYAKPGTKKISGKWSGLSGQKDSEISVDLSANNTYFINLTGISQLSGASGTTMFVTMGSGLNLVDPVESVKRLKACCKLQAAELTTY